jgi:hypothetical protein
MRRLKDVQRLVGHAVVHATPEGNKAVLDELLKELAAAQEDMSLPTGRRLWHCAARSPLARAAVAAALIVIGTLLIVSRTPPASTRQPPRVETLSAADLLTVGCLNAACRRGGLPEVEKQCERATQKLQSQPERISLEQLITEMKGT